MLLEPRCVGVLATSLALRILSWAHRVTTHSIVDTVGVGGTFGKKSHNVPGAAGAVDEAAAGAASAISRIFATTHVDHRQPR